MQPGQYVAQKFTISIFPLSDAIEICLPSMAVKFKFGTCFLSFKFKNKNVSNPATITGIKIFAGEINNDFILKIWALLSEAFICCCMALL